MKKLFISLLLSALIIQGYAQITKESAFDHIADVLKKYNPSSTLEIKKDKYLIYKEYKGGALSREDRIYIYLMDEKSITFIEDEQVVQVKCKPDEDGVKECVERNLPEKKIKKPYNRMTFTIGNDAAEIDKFAKALKHFILFSNDDEYTTNETLD